MFVAVENVYHCPCAADAAAAHERSSLRPKTITQRRTNPRSATP